MKIYKVTPVRLVIVFNWECFFLNKRGILTKSTMFNHESLDHVLTLNAVELI